MSDPLIMLVDDDPDFREVTQILLEAHGYRVIGCSSAAEAMSVMAQTPPGLIITDLMMHTLDAGFAFVRQLKMDERFGGIPVIMLTGVSAQRGFDFSPRSTQDSAAMGVAAFFDKPVDPEVLLNKIRELTHHVSGK